MQIAFTALISLDEAEVRRKIALDNAPVDYEFISAVDARPWDEDALQHRFDMERAVRRYGRRLSGGEVGCTLSHVEALTAFLAATEGQPDNTLALISEDDALWGPGAKEQLARLVQGRPHEMTFLYSDKVLSPWQFRTVANIGTFQVVRPLPIGLTTLSYLVSRRAAKVFVDYARRNAPFWLADDYQLLREMGLDVLTTIGFPLSVQDTPSMLAEGRDEFMQQMAPLPNNSRGKRPFERRFREGTPYRRFELWHTLAGLHSALPLAVRTSKVGRFLASFINDLGSGQSVVQRSFYRVRGLLTRS